MSNDDVQVILEHFDDKFALLLENIDTKIEQKLAPLAENVTELKTDIKIIKAAVTDTNNDLHVLGKRVDQLEATA